jgi:hypothetical protein
MCSPLIGRAYQYVRRLAGWCMVHIVLIESLGVMNLADSTVQEEHGKSTSSDPP